MSLLFNFEGREIRVAGDSESPLFVAKDICDALELSDVSMTLSRLEDDEKGASLICTLGGEQRMLCVTEAGLYRLIFRSNKPQAEKFRRWVFHDVLPAIRKGGNYSVPSVALSLRGPLEPVEVQRQSVLMFLHDRMPDAVLPPRLIRQFGLDCRSMAKALGVRGILMEDPILGEALVWPAKFLDVMARSLPAPKAAALPLQAEAGRYQVETWGNASLGFDEDYNTFVTVPEMFAHYNAWCLDRGETAHYRESAAFARAMLSEFPAMEDRKLRRRVGTEGKLTTYGGVYFQKEKAS